MRVAGERFRVVDGARIGAAQHRPLDAAMLIAQRNFQVVDRLAVALEAEMARLDDAGVDRADGHLVDLLARHLEEVGHAASRRSSADSPFGGKRTGFSHGWPSGRTFHCSKISRSNSGPAGSRA